MKVDVSNKFLKDFKKAPKDIQELVYDAYELLDDTDKLEDLTAMKALKGRKGCYRMRLGQWRVGFELDGDIIKLKRLLPRDKIYAVFP